MRRAAFAIAPIPAAVLLLLAVTSALPLPSVVAGRLDAASAGVDASDTPAITVSVPGIEGTPGNLVADPAIAAGTDRVVVISNAGLAMYDKSGNVIASKALHSFFLPAMAPDESSAGDVDALFDPRSQRFFLSEAAKVEPQTCEPGTCVGHTMLAVSKSATPASFDESHWHFYALDRYLDRLEGETVPTTHWGDFDHLAADDDVLVVTSRQYRESDGAPVGPKIRILDKAGLVTGTPPSTWHDILSEQDLAGIMPAKIFGDAPAFFLVSRGASSCGVQVWGLDTALDPPAVEKRTVSLNGNCAEPDPAPQPSSAPDIDIAGIGFNTQPVYRDGRIWVADTWRHDFGSGPVAVIVWAELDVSGWPETVSVVQQGRIGRDAVWSFYPSLTVDPRGNLTIAFYTASASDYATLNVAARLASDPLGTMRQARLVRAGDAAVSQIGPDDRNRFADYSDIALDPDDGASWIHGQYGTSGEWRTWVARTNLSTLRLWRAGLHPHRRALTRQPSGAGPADAVVPPRPVEVLRPRARR